jgi:hypothetical protein
MTADILPEPWQLTVQLLYTFSVRVLRILNSHLQTARIRAVVLCFTRSPQFVKSYGTRSTRHTDAPPLNKHCVGGQKVRPSRGRTDRPPLQRPRNMG